MKLNATFNNVSAIIIGILLGYLAIDQTFLYPSPASKLSFEKSYAACKRGLSWKEKLDQQQGVPRVPSTESTFLNRIHVFSACDHSATIVDNSFSYRFRQSLDGYDGSFGLQIKRAQALDEVKLSYQEALAENNAGCWMKDQQVLCGQAGLIVEMFDFMSKNNLKPEHFLNITTEKLSRDYLNAVEDMLTIYLQNPKWEDEKHFLCNLPAAPAAPEYIFVKSDEEDLNCGDLTNE